jgi:hypothetical protein
MHGFSHIARTQVWSESCTQLESQLLLELETGDPHKLDKIWRLGGPAGSASPMTLRFTFPQLSPL